MVNSDETLRMSLIEYLTRVLKAYKVSPENIKGIIRFLHKDAEKMMALMDWLCEEENQHMTEREILKVTSQLLNQHIKE